MTQQVVSDEELKMLKEQLHAEEAKRAAQVFRRMQPTLTGFARAITGDKKVSVQLDTGSPRTDGHRILMRPPIELGQQGRHIRELCDKRDDRKWLRCDACAARETVIASIFHEIAHIAEGSFIGVEPHNKDRILEVATQTIYPNKWREVKQKLYRYRVKEEYMPIAHDLDPHLPWLFNGLEDARVNCRMFEARPGVKVMMEATTIRLFENGVEQDDRTIKYWHEYPLNMQAVIGTYCIASGYDFIGKGWLNELIEDALKDEKLNELVNQATSSVDGHELFLLCFPVLQRLRELGLCQIEIKEQEPQEPIPSNEPPDEEQQPEEGGEDGDEDGSSEDDTDNDEDSAEASGSGQSKEQSDSDGQDRESDDDAEADEDSSGTPGTGASSPGSPDESEPESGSQGEGEENPGSGSPEEGEDTSESTDSDSEDLIDTGADKGEGGVEIKERIEQSGLEMGDAEDCAKVLKIFGDHEEEGPKSWDQQAQEARESQQMVQGLYFETPSMNVDGIHFYKWDSDEQGRGWSRSRHAARVGQDGDLVVPESILGPALLQLRRAVADNERASYDRNRKSGRVNVRVLGKRAHSGDDRLFQKKSVPGKKNYFVLIAGDISGSTIGLNIHLIKRAVSAQAELCQRLGIDFAVYMHSGAAGYDASGSQAGEYLDWYMVKEPHEAWDGKAKERLAAIQGYGVNLDGHAVEQCRRICDSVRATNKIIMYYTDGKMPAGNYDEELEILQREIRTCKRKNYALMGVGIRTDSPIRHGLETVQVDDDRDVVKVVRHLGKKIQQLL